METYELLHVFHHAYCPLNQEMSYELKDECILSCPV